MYYCFDSNYLFVDKKCLLKYKNKTQSNNLENKYYKN